MAYRLNGMSRLFSLLVVAKRYTVAFGFLASQQVKDAGVGNAGLHDRKQYGTLSVVLFH